jgi:dTDP-4-dehydrorhamnose reductase
VLLYGRPAHAWRCSAHVHGRRLYLPLPCLRPALSQQPVRASLQLSRLAYSKCPTILTHPQNPRPSDVSASHLQVDKVVGALKPDVVVYAARETPAAVGELKIEKDPRSNAAGNVAAAAAAQNAWMLYVSCDSVFAAASAPATAIAPDAPTAPNDSDADAWYKALSERAVLAAGG